MTPSRHVTGRRRRENVEAPGLGVPGASSPRQRNSTAIWCDVPSRRPRTNTRHVPAQLLSVFHPKVYSSREALYWSGFATAAGSVASVGGGVPHANVDDAG